MDKEEGKNHRVTTTFTRVLEPDFGFKWGNRKRLRCVKIKEEEDVSVKSEGGGGAVTAGAVRKKITSRIDRRVVRAEKETPISLSPNRLSNKNSDSATLRSSGVTENRKTPSCSPEKEDRYYTTRGSLLGFEDNAKIFMETGAEDRGFVWPKLFISLSSKEKEEDFMAMKGCKLPQRPKKRAKFVQRSLLLVSPGAWLSDLCQERYEVREKKTSKKRPRGLKAMGSMESDSE